MCPHAETTVDVPRLQDALARARADEMAGDEAGAESVYRAVLAASRDSGTLVAWIALANLTGLFQRQGRESETLILIRRLIDGAGAFEPFRGVWARQARCMALANIEAWEHLALELPIFESAIPGCPEPHATIFVRSSQALRAALALEAGSLDDARAAHAALVARLDDTAAPNTRRFTLLIGADVEFRSRQFPEALRAAREARAHVSGPVEALASIVVEAECLVHLEEPDAAHLLVREALEAIDASPLPPRAPALLVKAGPRLAALVAEHFDDDILTRRTYDLAGAAIMRRTVEIERDFAELPELADPHPDDRAALAAFRARFRESKSVFLNAVARILGHGCPGGTFLRPGDDALTRVCAWCLRLHRDDGTWLPIAHFLAETDHGRVTHGICDRCEVAATA